MTKTSKNRHHVVIIGAGFGGIEVANQLAGVEVDVTIIDRRNHHLFQPLLYQVAGASLSTSEIAWPIRHLGLPSPAPACPQPCWRRRKSFPAPCPPSCRTPALTQTGSFPAGPEGWRAGLAPASLCIHPRWHSFGPRGKTWPLHSREAMRLSSGSASSAVAPAPTNLAARSGHSGLIRVQSRTSNKHKAAIQQSLTG